MERTKEISLDDRCYYTTAYTASTGLKLLHKLTRILGKPLAMLAGAGGLDAELNTDTLGDAIQSLVSEVNEDEFEAIISKILSTTQIKEDGGFRPINFNIDFSKRYGHLFKLIKEVIVYQYDDFLGEVLDAGKNMSAMQAAGTNQAQSTRLKAK